jgi:hypothetical protein
MYRIVLTDLPIFRQYFSLFELLCLHQVFSFKESRVILNAIFSGATAVSKTDQHKNIIKDSHDTVTMNEKSINYLLSNNI